LQGEFDGELASSFQDIVKDVVERKQRGIVLDMSNVSFVDSVGLEQLLWSRDFCHDGKCQMRMAGLEENCAKILEITRLESEFDKYAELAEAVKSFA